MTHAPFALLVFVVASAFAKSPAPEVIFISPCECQGFHGTRKVSDSLRAISASNASIMPAAGFLWPLHSSVSIPCACQYKETAHSSNVSTKRCATLFLRAMRETSFLKTPTLVVREIADYSAQRGLIKYRPVERALKQAIAIYHEWKVRPAVHRFGDLLLNVQHHNRVDLHTAYSPV